MKKEHILVIRFSAMGDVAMTVPVIQSLAEQYPDLRITMLSQKFARPFFEHMPHNVSFMEADLKNEYHGVKGLNALYRRLMAKNFTAIADLHSVLRSRYLRMRFNIDRFKVAHIDKHRNLRHQLTPQTGELVTLPDHAKTLRILADSYCESYYRGELAQRLVEFSDKTGGYLSLEDLADYRAEWVEPVHINYHGYDVWEMPPNGHGITALMALNILKDMEIGAKDTGDTFHKQIEAMKLAFADGMHYIADPRYMQTRVEELLSDAYAAQRRALIGETALEPTHGKPFCGGTVYLCTADGEGNMVSFIESNYKDFGSGIVLPGYGINLNDRGSGFSLNPELDDYLAPRKKPYHTIIPGFLTHEGEAVGPFGVMGAYMQPQGHVQVIMNTVDWLLNPQSALDAPRWQWIAGKEIWLESSVAPEIVEDLRRRGHEVRVLEDDTTFGRGEIIWRDSNGVLAGATEPRADGVVAAW